jgi:enamine deaminase RidA (YjgF/YER057c/UK114 family)
MPIERITSAAAPEPPPERWSNCLLVDGIAYVSGMVALMGDEAALAAMDEYDQAKACFAKIRALVEAAGGTMADVVKIAMFVTDIGNGDKIWRARREVFTGNFPASTMVEVRALATPRTLIEIEAIAHIGKGARAPG